VLSRAGENLGCFSSFLLFLVVIGMQGRRARLFVIRGGDRLRRRSGRLEERLSFLAGETLLRNRL